MKVLELMHSLEEAYDRFGDIEVNVVQKYLSNNAGICERYMKPREVIIESEEFIIECGD